MGRQDPVLDGQGAPLDGPDAPLHRPEAFLSRQDTAWSRQEAPFRRQDAASGGRVAALQNPESPSRRLEAVSFCAASHSTAARCKAPIFLDDFGK